MSDLIASSGYRRHVARLDNETDEHYAQRVRALQALERGVPREIAWDAAFERLEDSAPLLRVRQWLASAAEALVLAGPPGTGKTTAAYYAIVTAGGSLVKAATLARASMFGDDIAEASELHSLLVLDDLGAEAISKTFPAVVDEIIDRRYDARLRTLVTTNLPRAALLERYGVRVVERIEHRGPIVELSAKAKNFRRAT